MIKFFYLSLLILGLASVKSSVAQVSVNINIGSQPLWGPVGYDYVRYYYMPEIDVYYNVNSRNYTYWRGNKWVTKSKLPGNYKNFDVYRTYKVVINESNPWRRHPHYRHTYARHAHNHSQVILRDGRKGGQGHRYQSNKGNDKKYRHDKDSKRYKEGNNRNNKGGNRDRR